MQEAINLKPSLIEKEIIPELKFKNLSKVPQDFGLMDKLLEATRLGNSHHVKVGIIFEDDEGLKRVDTTIWSTGKKFICLKGGIYLPIDRIHRIIV